MEGFRRLPTELKSAKLQYVSKEGMKEVEVSVGDRVYFNWGAYLSGDAGTVVGFKWSEFYERFEAEILLDNGNSHTSDRMVEYGIGGYLERLGGEGIYARKE